MSEDSFQTQARADAYRMQGAQSYAQGITGAANAAAEGMRYMQDLSLRQTEMQMRVEAHQQEQAINAQKLQALMAMDQVKTSRLQTEALEKQNKMADVQIRSAEFQLDQQKDAVSGVDPDTLRTMQFAHMAAPALESGLLFVDETGKTRRPMTKDERDAALEQAQQRKTRLAPDTTVRQQGADNNSYKTMLKAIDDELETIMPETANRPWSKEQRDRHTYLVKKRGQILLRMSSAMGLESPESDGSAPEDPLDALLRSAGISPSITKD